MLVIKNEISEGIKLNSNFMFLIVACVSLLSGCVSVGSADTILKKESNKWKEIHEPGKMYYEFQCENKKIDVKPIPVKQNMWIGFIIPIIPFIGNYDQQNELLEIKYSTSEIDTADFISSFRINDEVTDFVVENVYSNNFKISPTTARPLAAVNSIEITFRSLSPSCPAPQILLTRQKEAIHDIVFSMGP